jgi:hypothetical protein
MPKWHGFYLTMGRYDIVLIVDAPDAADGCRKWFLQSHPEGPLGRKRSLLFLSRTIGGLFPSFPRSHQRWGEQLTENGHERKEKWENFFLKWSLDASRVPIDPKERGAGWTLLMNMIKDDRENGILHDWGAFPSEGKGYCIVEGSNLDVMKMTDKYVPYVSFEVYPVATILEVDEFLKHMTG